MHHPIRRTLLQSLEQNLQSLVITFILGAANKCPVHLVMLSLVPVSSSRTDVVELDRL